MCVYAWPCHFFFYEQLFQKCLVDLTHFGKMGELRLLEDIVSLIQYLHKIITNTYLYFTDISLSIVKYCPDHITGSIKGSYKR